jgi:hypothetical protein
MVSVWGLMIWCFQYLRGVRQVCQGQPGQGPRRLFRLGRRDAHHVRDVLRELKNILIILMGSGIWKNSIERFNQA